MKPLSILIVLILAVGLIGGILAVYKARPGTYSQKSGAVTTATGEISVTANNGQFSPQNFELKHTEEITLNIKAVDRDYEFSLADFDTYAFLPKGETTQVVVRGLGVGTYPYSCGQGCAGSVTVIAKMDEE